MRILLTGAFGNIGTHTLPQLLADGHTVRCFDVATPANRRAANDWQKKVEILWGDLRHPADVAAAVWGQDLVIHLAFVVPRLSVTGVNSEDHPDWARAVNVGGTLNLLAAMQACPRPPRLIFASSLHVYGRTQHLPPPRRVSDPVQPVEHYAWHKITCEEMVKASTVPWTILRFGAAMPVRLIVDPGLFDVPLDNRIEYVHAHDVGIAIAHAVQSSAAWGKTWLIGGGPRCQYVYREVVERVLTAVGIGMLPAAAFSTTPFAPIGSTRLPARPCSISSSAPWTITSRTCAPRWDRVSSPFVSCGPSSAAGCSSSRPIGDNHAPQTHLGPCVAAQ